MAKHVLLAGILGTLAMFVWSAIAHMALPLGEAGIRQITNEQPLLGAMQSTLSEHGFYMFPNMPPGNDQAQYQQKIETGPSGMLIYFPKRDFSLGKSLAIEFLTQLVQVLIAVYLLSLVPVGTFGGRVSFFVCLGLLAAIASNVSFWNWYGFPLTYVFANIAMIWIGYLCAGLVASMVLRRSA